MRDINAKVEISDLFFGFLGAGAPSLVMSAVYPYDISRGIVGLVTDEVE